MAKGRRVSVDTLDKIIANQKSDKIKEILSYSIGEQVFEIKVKTQISNTEMYEFIERVSNVVCSDNGYTPSLYTIIYTKCLFEYYTNLKYEFVNDKYLDIYYNTDLVSNIENYINCKQLKSVINCINDKIEFNKSLYLSAQSKKLEENLKEIENAVSIIKQFSQSFEDINIQEILEVQKKIADKSEKEIVNVILDKQEQE